MVVLRRGHGDRSEVKTQVDLRKAGLSGCSSSPLSFSMVGGGGAAGLSRLIGMLVVVERARSVFDVIKAADSEEVVDKLGGYKNS